MISLCRNFLVFFLVLLQFIAPLVHAHVNEHYASNGIHLPGMEARAPKLAMPVLLETPYVLSSNDLIVGMNTGIQVKQDKKRVVMDDSTYIHQPLFVLNLTLVATDINFSPPLVAVVFPFAPPPYASRAPPLF